MEVDNTKPWVESTEKKPKLGEVLKTIIELKNESENNTDEVQSHLEEVEVNVTDRINKFKDNVTKELQEHTSKTGPVHGETKSTIGLSKKENLPAATIEQIKGNKNEKAWLTPETLSLLLEKNLAVDKTAYMESGSLPLSSGRTLGKNLSNQIFKSDETVLPNKLPVGQVSYLFSTEVDYVMFAELGEGRVTDFSEGGLKAPVGTTRIDILNNNILAYRGEALSINNLTTSDKFAQKVTGLAWGFGEYNGNFYDSNFSETVKAASVSDSTIQEVESSLFDPTLVCKPDKVAYLRNFNLTKHNFNELYINRNGNYPFNDANFLSSDNFICHIANVQVVSQNNIYGLTFDFVTGDISVPDWLPNTITKTTDKILSKVATYTFRATVSTGTMGYYTGSKYTARSSKNLPLGHTGTNDFANATSVGPNYLSVWIPFNDIINGFNSLSAANQKLFIDNLDKDLLKRTCLVWNNEYIKTGFIRIPLYYEVPNTTKAWSTYIDLSFTITSSGTTNSVSFSGFNFDSTQKPTIAPSLDLTLAKAGSANNGFTSWAQDTKENPLHPKVFKGCLLETGGHITAYVLGHRQYICHYKHNITSIRSWIINNLTPVLETKHTKILDVGMLPANRFYYDNTRTIPLSIDENNRMTYLTRARNKNNKYAYGVFTVNAETFDLLNTRKSEASEITWVEKRSNKNLPILIDNSNLSALGINTTGLVFSEINGFIGYQDHGFNGIGFKPTGPTEIDPTLKQRILLEAKIINPYPIFFYFEQVLYWAIASRDGQKNAQGYDVCVGGIRVDMLKNNDNYTIRSLPEIETKTVWGKLYNDYPKGLIRGRESESFDDVFVINKNGYDTTTQVFVNYPDLDGRYYNFTITADDSGYKYPTSLNPPILDLKKECDYGGSLPYVFYGSYFNPFMMVDKFYLPDQDLFKLVKYDKSGSSTIRNYYMGWKNEIPLYTVGENITVDGQSLNLTKGIYLPDDGTYEGKLFLSYYNETFALHTSNYNPLSYPTEPSNSILFVGFIKKIGDLTVLSYHAPRGFDDIAKQDFINSLLPVVDGKQMSVDSMGSTFPVLLGKLNSSPRQYFFKAPKLGVLTRISEIVTIYIVPNQTVNKVVDIDFTNALGSLEPTNISYSGPTSNTFIYQETQFLGNNQIRIVSAKPAINQIATGTYYISFTYNNRRYENLPIATVLNR